MIWFGLPLIHEKRWQTECNFTQFSQEYFSGNYTERWEEAFDTVDNALNNISLYLSCFDFDKFVGMRSERELEVSAGSIPQIWELLIMIHI